MIDTHCHIDDSAYEYDREEVIQRQKMNEVEDIIVPGVDEDSVSTITTLCHQYPRFLFPALGLHPENIKDNGQRQLNLIKAAIDSMKDVTAVGEIGLDYHYSKENKEIQQNVYATQLHWAHERNLPVIVHNRDATQDVLEITKKEYDKSLTTNHPLRGVIHCFSGSLETANEWIKIGFFLGIGGVVTFRNSTLPKTLTNVPIENIILETDGPFLTPTPFRGQRNESRYISYVIDKLVSIYPMSYNEIEDVTSHNAIRLFNLHPHGT